MAPPTPDFISEPSVSSLLLLPSYQSTKALWISFVFQRADFPFRQFSFFSSSPLISILTLTVFFPLLDLGFSVCASVFLVCS
jgi:hypothetical protein